MQPRKILASVLVAGVMLGASVAAVTASPAKKGSGGGGVGVGKNANKKPTTTTTSTSTTSTSTTSTSTSTTTTLPPPPPVTVTVTLVDTGVRPTHQEFDYGGPSSTTDQFVAWWDFSADAANHLPAIGETWDTVTPDPFDANGHGTATASAAVGLNAAPASSKEPSFCPGCKLAVAKVGDGDGSVSGDLAQAIKWARETVHSDVISMSIGEIVPLPAALSASVFREIRLARQAGILVTVSNGNGWANAGLVPGEPGFATAYGNSPYALGVGASGADGPFVTTDPEVVASYTQRLASRSCDTCYASISGTSFSNPLTAGFAAHLMKTARANGGSGKADYIEQLVKYSARNTDAPPTIEGYGVIDAAQQAAAEAHAAAGTLPTRPSPDVDGLYVETVQGTLDSVWTDKAAAGLQVMTRTFLGTTSPIGTIGASAPTGLSDAEVYKIHASAGELVDVDLALPPVDGVSDVNDVDLYVVRTDNASPITGSELTAQSNNGPPNGEHVTFVSPSTADYYVIVLGWSVTLPQPFSLTSNKALEYWYQEYVAHTFGTGIFL
jgi:hypothetical protein